MSDTSSAATVYFRKMIMARTPQERFLMGCSMYDAARKIVENAIVDNNSALSPSRLKEKIFLRFYGRDFNELTKKKILNALGDGSRG